MLYHNMYFGLQLPVLFTNVFAIYLNADVTLVTSFVKVLACFVIAGLVIDHACPSNESHFLLLSKSKFKVNWACSAFLYVEIRGP